MNPDNPAFERLKRIYFAPLRLLVRMIGVFTRNRDRVSAFTAREAVAAALKALSLLTLLAWLLIWVLAGEEQRQRLTEAVSDYWAKTVGSGSTGSGDEDR